MVRRNVQIIDLSQPFHSDIPVYHIYSKPQFGIYHKFELQDVFYDRVTGFYTHSGTHMDAPRHFNKDGWTLDRIPLDVLIGQGVVLDLPKRELGKITAADFEKAKSKIDIKKKDVVIINTGWHHKWEDPDYPRKFPGIMKDGAEWLVEAGIKMVGMDWICVDHPSHTDMGDNSWISHKILLNNNIPIIENIGGDVDKVKGQRVMITALPVKVAEGDGFPLRVIATVEK